MLLFLNCHLNTSFLSVSSILNVLITMRFQVVALLQTALCGVAVAHSHHHERTFSAAELEELENKWGTDCAYQSSMCG